jgi:hypothetical protein
MRKVKIKSLPQAKNGAEAKPLSWNGAQMDWPTIMSQFSQPNVKVNNTLQPVDRDEANLEAEKNERVVVNQDGIPTNFKVGGKRHSEGGTPLNLPANSFVFSDTKDMKIKDPTILAQFGITTGVHTPAGIAKRYDINKYRAILADKDASDLDKKTAEMMIANYNLKLAKLSLVQESKKGFPQGIPAIAMPYIESLEINPDDFLTTQSQQTPFSPDMMQLGGGVDYEAYMPAALTFNVTTGVTPAPKSITSAPPTDKKKVQLSPEEWVRLQKASMTKDIVPTVKQIEINTPEQGYEVDLSPEEAKALGINNAYGGNTYQQGGPTKKYKLTPEQYLKLQAMRKKGTPPTSTSKAKSPTSTTKPAGEFNPYGQSMEELNSYLVPGAYLRKGKVSTRQSETTKGSGIYGDVEVSVDQFLKNNPTFAKEFADKHPGEVYNPKNKAHVAEFQEYYNPAIYKKVYDQLKGRGVTEDKAKQMADAAVNEFGFKKGEKARDFDQMHGQFTGSRVELQFKDSEKQPDPVIEEPVKVAAAPLEKKVVPVAHQQGHDPWWLQDIVKTAGAAGDFFRVKKYSPWQATPGLKLPDPTFYDPSRELAANAEFANIGTQGLAAFTNPQAFAAGFSHIQGQGAKNAADILGRYNNMNVGVANDFEVKRTDMENQYSANLAGLSTQLADKYAILNQQFDNSRNMARQNLRQSYIDAVTNKNYTGNVNDLYDQYKIDPRVGGRIKWTHGRPLTPDANNNNAVESINQAASEFMKQNPGLTRDKALEAAMKLYNGDNKQPSMYDPRTMGYPG